jgi:hypothetical protein
MQEVLDLRPWYPARDPYRPSRLVPRSHQGDPSTVLSRKLLRTLRDDGQRWRGIEWARSDAKGVAGRSGLVETFG